MHRIVALAALVAACGSAVASDTSSSEALTAAASPGDPLPGLTASQLARFQAGRAAFVQTEDAARGLGPVFNEASCAACHAGPDGAAGGTNQRIETRFGRVDASGNFDPMIAQGGSLLQDYGIGEVAGGYYAPEVVPEGANVIAGRRTTPLFGLGLVDAVSDDTFRALALLQKLVRPAIAGKVSVVTSVATGKPSVGKFGWKAQVPSLFVFSGDAYLNEMGITNPLFPHENCPQGDCSTLSYNPRPDLNDDGEDLARFADFMTFLAPPQLLPGSVRGEAVAARTGCLDCHVPMLVTAPNAVAALSRRTLRPFSDFLLHDMGTLGDGIVQGAAGAREMRTAPLWGLRTQTRLLHDGRAATITEAILAHDGQGKHARDRFAALDDSERAALLAFLGTL